MDLPADAGGEIIDRRVGVRPGDRATALILSYQFAYCTLEAVGIVVVPVDFPALLFPLLLSLLLPVDFAAFREFRVFTPATPSAVSLLAFWKAFTASAVLLPYTPSALPSR